MKFTKKQIIGIISFVIAGILIIGGLYVLSNKSKQMSEGNIPEVIDTSIFVKPNDFYTDFQNELLSSELKDKNYVVSPVSFRNTMLAYAYGSVDETKIEVLRTMGFSTLEEYEKWQTKILSLSENKNTDNSETANTVFDLKILSGIWENTSNQSKVFDKKALDTIHKKYNIPNYKTNAKTVTKEINNYFVSQIEKETFKALNEKHDYTKNEFLFVDTTYLETKWKQPFTCVDAYKADFTTKSGEKIKKDYMRTITSVKYYKDKKTELIVVPMENNINVAFVKGDATNVYEKINNAVEKRMFVILPIVEFSNEIPSSCFENYFKNNGAELLLTEKSDFSTISENSNVKVSNLLQKTEFTMNEAGVGVGKPSVIIGYNREEAKEIKKFYANSSFNFYVYSIDEKDTKDTLLCGQVCE